MEQQSITVQCTSNMMQYMAWYARYDIQCICVLRKGKDEQGINLANQVCRWKDEMISVKIDIEITGNGCTVCKWQDKYGTKLRLTARCYLACNKKLCYITPTWKQSIWQWSIGDALQKRNTELRLNHIITGSNKPGESAKKYQGGHGINSITKQCSEQVINMLQELIIAKQGMAWIYSKHRSKVPYWP